MVDKITERTKGDSRDEKVRALVHSLLLVAGILSNDSFAQAYTHWHLPEGAIARLGKGKINDAKFSPDGSQLAIASDIGVWVYDAKNGTEIALLTGQIDGSLVAKAIAFAPDGKTLAVGSPRTIELWDIKTRQRLSTFKMSSVHDLKFSQDSEMLACVSWSKGVEYASGNRFTTRTVSF